GGCKSFIHNQYWNTLSDYFIVAEASKAESTCKPANKRLFLDSCEVGEHAAEQVFMQEPVVLRLEAPVKVFRDLHGQFGDVIRLFDEEWISHSCYRTLMLLERTNGASKDNMVLAQSESLGTSSNL
ncbi:hypothetical protein MKW98_013275, partial [Papaver atlanticum]